MKVIQTFYLYFSSNTNKYMSILHSLLKIIRWVLLDQVHPIRSYRHLLRHGNEYFSNVKSSYDRAIKSGFLEKMK